MSQVLTNDQTTVISDPEESDVVHVFPRRTADTVLLDQALIRAMATFLVHEWMDDGSRIDSRPLRQRLEGERHDG